MIKKLLTFSLLAGLNMTADAKDYQPLVSDEQAHQQIEQFANDMASKHQFDAQAIIDKLTAMQHRQDIIARISKPAEALPWHRYRQIFIKDKRIDEGVEFWNQHADTLAKAEQTFGVDPAIIVGIIGVETFYGKIQGKFPVVEALHTLGFYYPKRAAFFRSELAQYYLLAREQNWSLDAIKGSYAGAMGMGQFISSSYRHYGFDFNQDGKVNLFNDPVDMIGSVANYFKKHHWRASGFVAQKISLQPQQKSLVQNTLKLTRPLTEFDAAGIDTRQLKEKTPNAGIFAFELADGTFQYWLTGNNFYAITRYNHNQMYALAVYQLSEAIKAKRAQMNASAENLNQ